MRDERCSGSKTEEEEEGYLYETGGSISQTRSADQTDGRDERDRQRPATHTDDLDLCVVAKTLLMFSACQRGGAVGGGAQGRYEQVLLQVKIRVCVIKAGERRVREPHLIRALPAAVEGAEVEESLKKNKKKKTSCWPKPKHSFENSMNKICICLESRASDSGELEAKPETEGTIEAGEREAPRRWEPREARFAV